MKILLTSEDSVRLEPTPGPMTIEAERADERYSPFHMLGSSLAYCTWSILASWASHAKIPTDGLVLDVSWRFVEAPHRIGSIALTFEWPELPPSRRAAAERVAAMCPVHVTLEHPPAITIARTGANAVAPAPPPAVAAPAVAAAAISAPPGRP